MRMNAVREIAVGLAVTLAACSAAPVQAPRVSSNVGYQEHVIQDRDGGAPLQVAIWYPTQAQGARVRMGLTAQVVARDAPVAGTSLPLVLMSHGTGGLASSHADTASALAAEGFVVAGVNHRGDNAFDDSRVGHPDWISQRVRDLSASLDYMLRDWPSHDALDGKRVGAYGFSAGATTVLMAIGGDLDLDAAARHCAAAPEFACQLMKDPPRGSPSPHEPRIRAAALAAPGFGFAFTPESLARIAIPVELWAGTADASVPAASNTRLVADRIARADYRELEGAGHFAFIAPCPREVAPLICADPEGFDRAAAHARMNRELVRFFEASLR